MVVRQYTFYQLNHSALSMTFAVCLYAIWAGIKCGTEYQSPEAESVHGDKTWNLQMRIK